METIPSAAGSTGRGNCKARGQAIRCARRGARGAAQGEAFRPEHFSACRGRERPGVLIDAQFPWAFAFSECGGGNLPYGSRLIPAGCGRNLLLYGIVSKSND